MYNNCIDGISFTNTQNKINKNYINVNMNEIYETTETEEELVR